MQIAIYTLTSPLHDEKAVAAVTESFLKSLHTDFIFKADNYEDYGQHDLDLIYVRTGGTESVFLRLLPELLKRSRRPFYLLTSGKSNSLAASMEILSFLQQEQLTGEIIHGQADHIAARIAQLACVGQAKRQLQGMRLGVIGAPSDWLISSKADNKAVKEKLGIDLVDIPMQRLLSTLQQTPIPSPTDDETSPYMAGALQIYEALRTLVQEETLNGFTLRCFDLLTAVKNTGCMALAKLNSDGIVAGCEGDVPAMLTMSIVKALCGVSGFQANPSTIDPDSGRMLFAHCTIPLNMVERYELDTHFESGIGVGIRGYMKTGAVTLFKTSGDLQRHFIAEGELVSNQSEPDLCRTQQVIRLYDASQTAYFLTHPIGNHHIVVPGHVGRLLEDFMNTL